MPILSPAGRTILLLEPPDPLPTANQMAEASRLSVIATPVVRPPAHGLEHTARHAGWANPLTIVPGAASDGRPECFVDGNGMLFANAQSSSKFSPRRF
jgi:hypothetical protein